MLMVSFRRVRTAVAIAVLTGLPAAGLAVIPTRAAFASGGPVISAFAGTGQVGCTGDGGPATSAELIGVSGMALDPAENLTFIDACEFRHISGGTINKIVTSGSLLPGSSSPAGGVYDRAGDFLFGSGPYIYEITPAGQIQHVAGGQNTYPCSYSGDGGPAISALFCFPFPVAVDGAGDIYVADSAPNNRIRMINTAGVVTTIAGNGGGGSTGDGGPATAASIGAGPVALDGRGNMYIADWDHAKIRKISSTGVISTVAGTGVPGCSGDGGPGPQAQVGTYISGLAVDRNGNVFFSDTNNDRIRMIDPTGVVTTQAGLGVSGDTGDGGSPLAAEMQPGALAMDSVGNLYVSNQGGQPAIREISGLPGPAGPPCTAGADGPVPGANLESAAPGNSPTGPASYGPSNPGATNHVCASGDPVNCFTGNFFETSDDLSIPGRGPTLRFDRTYNALDAATSSSPGPLGWGWSASCLTAKAIIDGSGNVTVHQDNGSTVEFVNSNGTYTTSPNVTASLVHNADGTFTYTLKDRERFTFDSTGRLLTDTDRNGYTSTLGYTGSVLSTVTDAAGRKLSLAYNSAQLLSSVTDPAGRVETLGYDSANNLTTLILPGGATTTFGYDSLHRMLTKTDPRGARTTNTYDTSSRVTVQTDPVGGTTTFSYGYYTTTVTGPTGIARVETFDGHGNPTQTLEQSPDHATTLISTFTYDASNNLLSATDPQHHVTTYTYDAAGNRLTTTDPLGAKTTVTYDGLNDPTTVTDALGVVTTRTYDGAGNLTSVSVPVRTGGPTATVHYGYDPSHPGDLVTVTDPLDHTTAYSYDAVGDPITKTDPSGDTTSYAYNSLGWLQSSTDPNGNAHVPGNHTTTYTYDPAGNVLTVTDPLGHTTTYSYDADRNRTSTTDPQNNTTTAAYDLQNQITTVTRPDHSTTTSAYDAAGNLVSQIDPLGHTTAYSYDTLGRLSSTRDALDRATIYARDAAGRVITTTNPAGQTTTNGYDADGRVISTNYSDGATPPLTYTYDADGRLTATTDSRGHESLTYDNTNHLIEHAASGNQFEDLRYSYDLAGHLASIVDNGNGGNILDAARTYDRAGRLHTVTDGNGQTVTFAYDANGNLLTEGFPGAVTDTTTYDADNQPTHITDAGPTGVFYDANYTRNPDGLITDTTTTIQGVTVGQHDTYDQLQRLTGTGPTAGGVTTPTAAYGYDAADRLTSQTSPATTTTYTYDAAGQIASTSATGPAGSLTGSTYTYTPQGQRSSQSGPNGTAIASYTWNQAGELTSAATPADETEGGTTYDAFGLLTTNSVALPMMWNLALPTPVINNDATTTYIAGPDGLPVEQNVAGAQSTFYHHDQLGSTVALTDSQGHVVQTYRYGSYGADLTPQTSTANPFRYAGQYTDPNGLIYMRARWYDPNTGQFLSPDPAVSLTGEPYAYVNDNPINRRDPSGLCAEQCWEEFDRLQTANAAAFQNCVDSGRSESVCGPEWDRNQELMWARLETCLRSVQPAPDPAPSPPADPSASYAVRAPQFHLTPSEIGIGAVVVIGGLILLTGGAATPLLALL